MNALKFTLATLVLLLSIACQKDEEVVFANNHDEDIYTFIDQLEDRHVDLYHKVSKVEVNEDIAALRAGSANLSNSEMIIGLMKILSKIGDSHTSLQAWSHLNFLPYEVEWLSDGVWVKSIMPGHEMALGQRIDAINGTPINQVLDSLRTLAAFENESNFKFLAVTYLRVPEFLQAFSFASPASPITLNLANGQDLELKPEELSLSSIYQMINKPLYLKNTTDYYWMEEQEDNRLLYIQYNKAKSRNDLTFQDFTNQIMQEIDDNTTFKKIVVDLRLNTGGNSSIARPLIQELRKRVDSGRLKAKDIYIVIGRRTFSSGLLNAWELHESFDPQLIGEPTGGKPNHFGEIQNFSLPNSGIKVWYSTKFFELSPTADDALKPDVLIELNGNQLLNGKDPVMEYILAE